MTKINLAKYQQLKVIDDLYNYKSLLDVLLNIEELLSSYNIYAYDKNWLDGEVVEGPIVSKYWVEITLKFDYKKMPDPEIINILNKVDILVSYTEAQEEVFVKNSGENNNGRYISNKKQKKLQDIWYVKIKIPRKLLYNDEINQELYYEIDQDVFEQNLDELLV